jgi:hypothetical protein
LKHFFLFLVKLVIFLPIFSLKNPLKIPKKFLCVLDHFLDIFMIVSYVESWLKNVWYFLVNCLLFLLKICEVLYVFVSKKSLKILKIFIHIS